VRAWGKGKVQNKWAMAFLKAGFRFQDSATLKKMAVAILQEYKAKSEAS